MRVTGLLLPLFALLALAACGEDVPAGTDRPGALQEEISDFRSIRIAEFQELVAADERFYRNCPPGSQDCNLVYPAHAYPALRGSAPFQAQITPPADYVDGNGNVIAAGDWEARHFCGASLIAPG